MPSFTRHHLIRALIIDMDGVLWRGQKPLVDLPAVFDEIRDRNLKITLATNNATRSVDVYVQKLHDFGVEIDPWQIINSAQATAEYLHERYPQGGKVFVIGEEGLVQALAERNIYPGEQDVLAVVVALDRDLTYDKLRHATMLIREGAPFIGTNPDRTFPEPEGVVPGTGAILAALEAATNSQPVIIGKPQPEMYRLALSRLGVSPSETLVVGDRLETDIAGGQSLGCYTALVLSGVTSEENARSWRPPPDLISKDIMKLIKTL